MKRMRAEKKLLTPLTIHDDDFDNDIFFFRFRLKLDFCSPFVLLYVNASWKNPDRIVRKPLNKNLGFSQQITISSNVIGA